MMALRPRASRAVTGLAAILSVLGCSPSLLADDPGAPEEISWRGDYSRALDEARTRNQLLWIQFTAPWCPNCTRMEQDSFPSLEVRNHARRSFVTVKLRSDVNEDLALGFDLSGLPATVIVAPNREVIAVRQGYLGPGDLAGMLRDALDRQQARLEASRKLTANDAKDGKRTPAADLATADAASRSGPAVQTRSENRPKTETQLALSGFCPVSLVSDKRLVEGHSEYTVTHEGRLYRFANLITFNRFRRDPERYIPVNGGNCPVAQLDRKNAQPGDPKYGVLFQGRLFLCASDGDRKRFLEQPARYAAVDVVEQGFCPHCLTQSGLLVRGDPSVELSREGKRYWFPDPTHREAFIASATSDSTRR